MSSYIISWRELKVLDALKSKRKTEVAKEVIDVEDEELLVAEPTTQVSHKEAFNSLSIVGKYLEENFTEYHAYYDVQDKIEKHALQKRAQSKLTDFF